MSRRKRNLPVDVSELRGEALWDHLFSPGHKPARTLTSKSGKRIGDFVTFKGRGHVDLLTTREPIVHDFLLLAETDFDVVRIVDLPMEVGYWHGDQPHAHVADLALGHRDRTITFVDVRRLGDIEAKPGTVDRAASRTAHYRERHGCTYVLHDERKVYPEPLFTNAKEMCEMARPQGRIDEYDLIRKAILRMPLPMTIHELMQASHESRRSGAWHADLHVEGVRADPGAQGSRS